MSSYNRAISVIAATALVASGFVMGAASAAEARPAQAPTAAGQPQLDLPPPVPLLELIPLELPVLSGLGVIGSLLSVSDPVWNLLGVTNSFQWLQDGVPIPGATGSTYLPTPDDAGHEISVLVTGSLLGVLPVSLITNALGIALPGTEATTPTATTPPRITGDPKVSKTLTVSAPVWNTDGVTTTYQWQRAGAAIPGATALTYTVAPADVAKALTVKVTGTKTGFTPGTATSAPVTGLLGDAPTAAAPPAIAGSPKVDQVLSVAAPMWSTTGVVSTYQWNRDSVPIPGATTSTYTVTPDDVSKALTVKVTGTKPGFTPGTTTSAPVTALLGDALAASTPPSISGAGRIGSLLSVSPGTWGSVTPNFTYQWLRNAVAIPGATGSTYVVRTADAARTLTVLVSATRPGYAPGSATTSGVHVAKMISTTRVALAKKQIRKGTRGLLKITVVASSLTPTGAVKVFDGSKLIKTYTIRAADNGSRTFKLPKLMPGKHKLKAVFKGNSAISGSTSRVVTLTVLKR